MKASCDFKCLKASFRSGVGVGALRAGGLGGGRRRRGSGESERSVKRAMSQRRGSRVV